MKKVKCIISIIALVFCAAQAEVVFFNYNSAPIEASVTNSGTGAWIHSYINLTDSGATLTGGEGNPVLLPYAYMNSAQDNGTAVNELGFQNNIGWTANEGDTIDSSYSWGTGESGPGLSLYSPGTSEATKFIPFRLNQGGGDYYYGWAKIYEYAYLNEGGAGVGLAIMTVQVLEMAYNDTMNTAISAGTVPEPATAGLLGLSAGALWLFRRAKNHYRS